MQLISFVGRIIENRNYYQTKHQYDLASSLVPSQDNTNVNFLPVEDL